MNVKFKLNKQQSRRLMSLAKTNSNMHLIVTSSLMAFIVDSIEYFKAVIFDVETTSATTVYSFNSQLVLSTCINEGFLSIDVEDGMIKFSLNNDTGSYRSTGVVSVIPPGRFSDTIRYLTLNNSEPYRLEALQKAKDLVTLCSATGDNLVITNETVSTESGDLKVFAKLKDEYLKDTIGITKDGLREIDKFGTDCKTYSIRNFLIFSKPGYTLAVRKANITSADLIPEIYLEADAAIAHVVVDVSKLATFLSEMSTELLKQSLVKCNFNIKTGVFSISNNSEEYSFDSRVRIMKQAEKGKNVMCFDIKDIYPLRKIITLDKNIVQFYLYNRILRLEIGPVNVLMRCELK